MKKIFVVIISLMCITVAKAQTTNTKTVLEVGMNSSGLSSTVLDSRIGFHIGPKFEFGLPHFVNGSYLSVGAFLSLKGAEKESFKLNPYYLEVPVHLGYKFTVNQNTKIFCSAGPYLAYGLFGKAKDDSDETDIFGDDKMKRFDFGLGFRVGAEFSDKIQLSVGYDAGLVQAFENDSDIKNRNFSLSLGYMF